MRIDKVFLGFNSRSKEVKSMQLSCPA